MSEKVATFYNSSEDRIRVLCDVTFFFGAFFPSIVGARGACMGPGVASVTSVTHKTTKNELSTD